MQNFQQLNVVELEFSEMGVIDGGGPIGDTLKAIGAVISAAGEVCNALGW